MGSSHKRTVYKPLEVNNPFEAQDKVHQDLLENERKSKKKWRQIAFISEGFVLLSICILFYAVSMQKTVPVLVAVAQWGEPEYLGEVKANKSMEIPEVAIQYQVRDFITKLRSISSDSDILYRDITQCYDMVTAKCEKKMTSELRLNDPFSEVGKVKRTVTIETVLRLSTETYQVDWVESSAGQGTRQVHIRGLFVIKLLEPPPQKRIRNPLGIYIDDYDMTEFETRSVK
ncbi:conjugal transfer protein TrbF [Spirochaetia bacterium]|nr:conjugal transfer protein TrbF [Spirochaetia bacterium]